jgi:hypothetical protein
MNKIDKVFLISQFVNLFWKKCNEYFTKIKRNYHVFVIKTKIVE